MIVLWLDYRFKALRDSVPLEVGPDSKVSLIGHGEDSINGIQRTLSGMSAQELGRLLNEGLPGVKMGDAEIKRLALVACNLAPDKPDGQVDLQVRQIRQVMIGTYQTFLYRIQLKISFRNNYSLN